MKTVAIIPARGGSKGIKRKNLVDFQGKPLVAHSIIHALESEIVDRVIVSTDDEEIAEVSKKYGAEVPFLRPAELAEDHVLDYPVFRHALDWLQENENYQSDVVVHLRPTAPYRKSFWIDEAVQLLLDHPSAHSVRSVSEPNMHPYRTFEIDNTGYLDPIMKDRHPEPFLLRRQDLPPMYFYNCVIDVTKPSTIYELESMTGSKLFPYIMNPDEVIDIDSERDLLIARSIFK
ncbi:MAG: hypothetical protein CL840_14320 [Crocinitomicaceae bacterium]|nr:hypothetical protein [Crocinitomicaceae bacterium]|tara:strand:- start:13308 stop:14003 length:696 start_codon:yes stop_codon:yes gene_type:complete